MKHESNILKRIKSYFMRRRSAREAHAFEREVERDAFLYEAVEGYEDMLTSDIQQALDELDDRLDEKTTTRAFYWRWQIAAALAVIIVGAGIFTYLGQQNGTATDSAISASEEAEEADESAVVEQSYQPRSGVPVFSPSDPLPAEVDSDSSVAEDIAAIEEAAPEDDADPQENSSSKEQPTLPKEKVEPAIAVVEDEPVGSALDTPKAKRVTADQEETLTASPSAANEVAFTQERAMSSKQMETVEMDTELSTAPTATPPNAVPENGMAAYQRYLRNGLQRTPGMPGGKVVLSFEFDRDGKPRKVEVVESLCTACDMEAIRLIEQGPAWKVEDRRERQRIEVEFR
jgi:outer membrane biosynthesis protein TonB